MLRPRGLVLPLVAAVLLAGCDTTVQETLGLGKRQPDEFQIVRRQPLIVPPDSTLRPPRPGEPGPAPRVSGESTGEQALLARVGGPVDPDIRRRLLEENTELARIDDSRFLIILDWQRRRMQPQGEPIDAGAEATRLREEGIAVPGPTTQITSSTPLRPASGS
jgi:hypothetical protein